MPQFPSVLARRKHVYGQGLYQRFPEPTGQTLPVDTDEWTDVLPPLPPLVMVGLVRRYLDYLGGYAAMVGRYQGEDAFSALNIPLQFGAHGLTDATKALCAAVYEDENFQLHSTFPVVGNFYSVPGAPDFSGEITSATPEWSIEAEADAVDKSIQVPDSWQLKGTGGFCLMDATYPGGSFVINGGTEAQHTLKYKANGHKMRVGAYAGIYGDITATGFIYALLWDKFPAPNIAEEPYQTVKQFAPGLYADEFRALILATGGRIVWQMMWLELMLQEDNIFLGNKGGRGGNPKGPKGKRTPVALPPVISHPEEDPWIFSFGNALQDAVDAVKMGGRKLMPDWDPLK